MRGRALIYLFTLVLVPVISANSYDFVGSVVGQSTGDQFGSAMCVLDFNGDGNLDLAVSAPAADDSGSSSGKVYIYFGGNSADTVADFILIGVASSFFGKSLASAGDFNNDSYEDLLVGAPFYDLPASNAGAVFLYYGGPSADSVVDNIFTGEAASDYFGISVDGIGDFNGDNFDDIAIGAYRAEWGGFNNAGKTYVYYGGTSPDFLVDLTLVGEADGERFGYSLASGDFNADSKADLAVGAYSYDDSVINQGRVYLFYGGSSVDSVFDITINGADSGEKYGWSLTTGFVNNDNHADLIMGTDGFEVDTFATGKIYVYYGGVAFDANVDYSYTLGRTEKDYLGSTVFSGFDINGDGYDEIISGMPGNNDGGNDAGGAVLLSGGSSISLDTTFLGHTAGEEAGIGVALWGDFGNAQTSIIVLGARVYDNYRGRVYLYSTSLFDTSGCCTGNVGDFNNDGTDMNIIDLTYLVDFIFRGGPGPLCPGEADANGDGTPANVLDLTFLVDRIFRGGSAPGPCP